ncbi:hypothetical protein Tco_0834480 [Tanacetum coccineum]
MKHKILSELLAFGSIKAFVNLLEIELHFPNPEKSLQFRQVEESESDNLFHDCIQGEDENAEDVQMADHLRPLEELLRIPILGIEDAIVVPAVLCVLTPVRGESLKILNGFDVSLPVSHSLWSSQSFGHQKAINGFDMPLPVAVCSGLVNPLAPRKGKFHGGLITMSTLCT